MTALVTVLRVKVLALMAKRFLTGCVWGVHPDIDDMPTAVAIEEPSDYPGLVGEWMDYL